MSDCRLDPREWLGLVVQVRAGVMIDPVRYPGRVQSGTAKATRSPDICGLYFSGLKDHSEAGSQELDSVHPVFLESNPSFLLPTDEHQVSPSA